MNISNGHNGEKKIVDPEVFFEIPVITTSSPSMDTDSEASPIYRNITKQSSDFHSDEETDTSFINNNNKNTNGINRRVSFLRSLSPANLNSSGASRGNVRRWSQQLTSQSKTRQNRTINMMPSRLQKLPTALSLDGQLHRIVDDESEFEQFVQEIEQYDYLMEDSATSMQIRNKILRALPQSLSIKRQIKSKVMNIVRERSHRMGMNRWKRALQFIGLFSTKSKLFVRNFMRNLRLWNDSMKEIEGHFGAGAETYFRLFRFLFVINLLLTIITFMFIVLPQLCSDYFQEKPDVHTRSRIVNTDKLKEEIHIVDLFTAEATSYHIAFKDHVHKLIQLEKQCELEQGSLENSTLFYGAYTDQRIKLYGSSTYSLPFAYLMTMVCFYSVTFITFSITTAESYRKSFIATSGGEVLRAHKLFCSWDFGISNQRAADMKHYSIFFELKSIVNEIYENECFLTMRQKMCGYIIRAVIWIFVIVVLFSIGNSIIFIPDIVEFFDITEEFFSYIKESPLFLPTIAILGLLLCQSLFEFLGYLEMKIVRMYRSPRSQLHIALIRNYLLNIVTITALSWFWLSNVEEKKCWETWIAQNIYRLIVIEFILVVCIGSIYRLMRFLVYKYVWSKIGLSEFNISRGCLGLIFNQTLLWIGIFFSPPLAAVIVLKMIATFYLKKFVLINFCKPPSKLWRSSQTFTLFLAMMFVSLTIVIVISLYILTQMSVSKTCGPFRNHIYMFHVLRGDILKLQENHFMWQLIMFLVRPAAIGLVLLTLCVLVYYLRSKSKARIEMVKLLKEMLYIEAKDKEFLLANITRITQNNEWLLEDFIKKSQFLEPHYRNSGRHHTENGFTDRTNGKYSFIIEEDSGSKSNKAYRVSINSRSINKGRKKDVETLRKRRPSTLENSL